MVWVPGNHELWTLSTDPVRLRGEARYRYLVSMCRRLGVLTPEDPFPVWRGAGGPVVIVPLFVLYDYTFRPDGTTTKAEALALAYETGIVCSDEAVLYPDPYPSRDAWCHARVEATERRLAGLPPGTPTVLVSHFPLTREPTRVLQYPEFAQWCGTERTADWHLRFSAQAVVYGHLHIPRHDLAGRRAVRRSVPRLSRGAGAEPGHGHAPYGRSSRPSPRTTQREPRPRSPAVPDRQATVRAAGSAAIRRRAGPGTSRRAVNVPARGSMTTSADSKPSQDLASGNHVL